MEVGEKAQDPEAAQCFTLLLCHQSHNISEDGQGEGFLDEPNKLGGGGGRVFDQDFHSW